MLTVGDVVLTVDGQALDPLDSVTADDLLNGAVGSTHAVGFGQTAVPSLANTTVNLLVEDLIPPPQ